jgi:hypothetical protein
MTNSIRLYQFGNFVFPSSDQKVERKIGVKNKLESTDYANAQIRVNKINKDFTEDTFYEVNFTSEDYNFNQLDKVFYSKPQKIFFVEKFDSNNSKGDYRVYFAYASIFETSKINLDCSDDPYKYQITLRQIDRRYLIEDNRLKFVKKLDLLDISQNWEGPSISTWEVSDNQNWEDKYYGKALNFNQLSSKQKSDLLQCCDEIGFFDYDDLYFKQEVNKIDVTAKNFIDLNLAGTDALNTQVAYSTRQGSNSLNIQSTAENQSVIFELEKDGVLPALGLNESIEILNNKDQSGFKISCLNPYCPPFLSVFTHKSIKLYNSTNNQPINFLDLNNSQNYLKWKIERVGNSSTFFELSSNNSIYPYFENIDFDTLTIKRNFSGNQKIRISNLPTFY